MNKEQNAALEAERVAFEAWFVEETKIQYVNSVKLDRDKRGKYLWRTAYDYWRVWQARAQLAAPAGVPDGWRLVPVKPTIDMVEVGYEVSLGQPDRSKHACVIEQYEAMLAAAPSPEPASDVVPYPKRLKMEPYQTVDKGSTNYKAGWNAAIKAMEVSDVVQVQRELPPFAHKVIAKLKRFEECASDGQGADIGRHWFDLLTQLGLLNRVQRSPGLWEITEQGEALLNGGRV